MGTRLRTLADVYGDNRRAQCQRCRRWTTADMVLDCSAVPDTAARVHGLLWDYICDGCREWLFRTGQTDRGRFYGLLREHGSGPR